MAKDEPSWLPVTCSGCSSRWYGIERAHCASCHRTFAAVDLFDQHRACQPRADPQCRNPTGLRMVRHAKTGVWEPRATPVRRRRAG